MDKLRVGVIGYGYWGPNVVRNIVANQQCELVRIADRNPARLGAAKRFYPFVDVVTEESRVTGAKDLDAVFVITPVSTHFNLGMQALSSGKHLWLEKPMAHSSEECRKLIEASERNKRVLLVDHTYVYTGAVRWIADMYRSEELGTMNYIDSVRINLGLYQQDINVIWDLVPHDFAIVTHLLGRAPLAITAVGAAHHGNPHEDVAYIHADYGNGLLVSFHVNWLSPIKVRKMIFAGSKKMVVYDDLETYHKVMVYDKGVELNINDTEAFYRFVISYRSGDMHAPNLDEREALGCEVDHFAQCALKGSIPVTDGQAGLTVVRMLEAAAESLKSKKTVHLSEK
jgi:predicted dehydrogenase